MHGDLQNFTGRSEAIMHTSLYSKIPGKFDQIYSTPQEENEFGKKMKNKDFEKNIFTTLDQLSEGQGRFYRDIYWKYVKIQPKPFHVSFYNTIKEVYSMENDSPGK